MASSHSHPSTWLSTVALASALAACGGNFVGADGETDGDPGDSGSDDGAGGAATGGTASGGAGTGGANTGGSPSGTGGAECCLAFPVCNGVDKQIDSEADCPVGAVCYSSAVCCSTIWCMAEEPACDAIPVCEPGEVQVDECPETGECTERSLCGQTISCFVSASACYPEAEPDRHYVSQSPGDCPLIDYSCPMATTDFSNECGCGCEQPSECPDYVNCEPTLDPADEPDPLCSSEECPYTMRVE